MDISLIKKKNRRHSRLGDFFIFIFVSFKHLVLALIGGGGGGGVCLFLQKVFY